MSPKRWIALGVAVTFVAFLLVQIGCATTAMGAKPEAGPMSDSTNFDVAARSFENSVPTAIGFKDWKTTREAIDRYFKNDQRPPGEIPVKPPAADELDVVISQGTRITWVGHSTMLVEVDGFRVLTDPVWSERVSPFPSVGPKRFHEPGIAFDELPPIDAVIISHDHYDHLDHDTIGRLAWRRVKFFVPLGVGAHLEKWGVRDYTELDWWQKATLRKGGRTLDLVATPARHFSGRGPFDRNATLWASWVIAGESNSVYFGGDTGYFEGFREIGERYGPFTATLMPIGAYDPAWADIHLNPEEAVRAHIDLGGTGTFMPIHYATFNLATHGWSEPMDRLVAALRANDVTDYHLPVPGESLRNGSPAAQVSWWRELR